MDQFDLTVTDIVAETALIRAIKLTRPHAYRLGVRLEQPSQGGSQFMHTLKVGDILSVSTPRNNFPLEPSSKPVVLLAGGIGVTPVLSMATALAAGERPYRFIYAGRSRDQLAFLGESEALCGGHLTIHTDDVSGI